MKDIVLTIACVITLFAAGCTKISHSGTLTATGKVFKVGGEAYNLLYVNGMVHMDIVRENVESIVETNDNDALGNPSDVKTVRTIRFKNGPIISGYAVDLAKVSPEAAIEYVKAMPELNKSTIEPVKTEPAKESSSIVQPIIGKIVDKLKDIAGDTEYKSPFSDNCELTNLYENNDVAYQAQLTADLLKYADDEATMVDTGELCKETLIHYAGRLAQLKAKGIEKATKITLGKATIKDGRLTYLRYRLKMSDGTYQDEDCPNCFDLEDK